MTKSYQILDLFAGVGGLSLGFELLRNSEGKNYFELYRAVEIDKYACETLINHYGDNKVIQGDLTKKEIHSRVINECRDKIDIVVGGIPCQSFSLIGPRSGSGQKIEKFRSDKRDFLYKEFKAIVKELSPKIVVVENVKGILSKKTKNGSKIINQIIYDFEKIGYSFKTQNGSKYFLLNAADYGVPQKRERVVLIGIKKDWREIPIPVIYPTHYNPKSQRVLEFKKYGLLPYVSLGEAIGDLPKVAAKVTGTGLAKEEVVNIKSKNLRIKSGEDKVHYNKNSFQEYLAKVSLSGKHFLNHVRPNGYAYIDHHVARSQQLSDLKLFRLMQEGETAKDFVDRMPQQANNLIKYKMNSFMDKYRKQIWNEPATTVFAHLEKDGNRFIHPKQPRTLTPREAARIQSFPDDFIFSGPLSKKFRQIGNAVPPLLSQNIAKAVLNLLEKS